MLRIKLHSIFYFYFYVYTIIEEHLRRNQWQTSYERVEKCHEVCLIIEDFDDIMDVTEKHYK